VQLQRRLILNQLVQEKENAIHHGLQLLRRQVPDSGSSARWQDLVEEREGERSEKERVREEEVLRRRRRPGAL
jgi:hypothetical protein